MSKDHPPALPHDALTEVFPDVFLVTGDFPMAPLLRIKRNMIVIRDRGELTLINSVRLTTDGEAALGALGTVRHLVKLGAFHDRDDPYYVERHRPAFWTWPRAKHRVPLTCDHELAEGAPLPVADATLLRFRNARYPEGAILLEREGGILITCDSVQNNVDFKGMSLMVKLTGGMMGFKGKAVIGPQWRKAMERPDGPPLKEDFDRLVALPFRHVLSAHGTPLRDTAPENLRASIARVWKR